MARLRRAANRFLYFRETPEIMAALDSLDMETRTIHCLLAEGARTPEEMARLRVADLMKVPNFGASSAKDFIAWRRANFPEHDKADVTLGQQMTLFL